MADGLQFDRAQFASGNHCTHCQNPLQDKYYRLLQDTVCEPCAEKAKFDHQMHLSQGGGLLRAAFFGLGAAFVGTVAYGTVTLLTGYEFALIAILIGWMVGKAMMRGSRGIGGRRFQVVAVILTYLSITGGYIPSIVKQIATQHEKKAEAKAGATPAEKKAANESLPGPGAVALALAVLVGVAAAAPFLNAASVSGLIGLLIIFFGLSRAWRETAESPFLLDGPFRFTPAESGAST